MKNSAPNASLHEAEANGHRKAIGLKPLKVDAHENYVEY